MRFAGARLGHPATPPWVLPQGPRLTMNRAALIEIPAVRMRAMGPRPDVLAIVLSAPGHLISFRTPDRTRTCHFTPPVQRSPVSYQPPCPESNRGTRPSEG